MADCHNCTQKNCGPCVEKSHYVWREKPLQDEIARLRTILTSILAHADAHDYAPPLKFSVAACREILEKMKS